MIANTLTRRLITGSAIVTILAGLIHLVLAPRHLEHAPAHGLFFLFVGLAQILWGVLVWRKPSLTLYYTGAIMAGWLIVLYALTRWLPAPFAHHSGAIETIDLVCKLCEVAGMITLLILIFQGLLFHASRLRASQVVSLVVLVAFLAAFVTYGVARAAEPVFPWLAGPVEELHHDEGVPSEEEHNHDQSFFAALT